MKIVIDARTMGSKPSGIGIYIYRYIKELINTSHELTLLTDVSASSEMQYMKQNNVRIVEFGRSVYRSGKVFDYFKYIRKYLINEQPDIFWEPNEIIPIKLRGYKGKVIVTVHDIFPITYPQYFGIKYSLYFRIMLRNTLRQTDVILYNSCETKKETERKLHKAARIKNYVHYIIIPENERYSEDNQGIKQPPFFLYVGNMERRKGVDVLLKAYDRYSEKGGKIGLVLAGKSRESEIDRLLEKYCKKNPDIKYSGYVSPEEKEKLYNECSCFVFPSRAEGFGICIIEAMHYYKPIIASGLSIFNEIAGNSINYYDISDSEEGNVENLCNSMLQYSANVDKVSYDEVCSHYLPENAGKMLQEILAEIEKV